MSGEASGDLERLLAGALRWIRSNLEFFDPASAVGLPATPRVQATLELALLRLIWARLRPEDAGLDEVTAFIQRIWRDPHFPQLIAADPGYAHRYGLIYLAMTPAGVTGEFHRAALVKLAADGYLASPGKSPYRRLESRYYADLAGVGHQIESYPELCASSILARLDTQLSITKKDAYEITHTIFYLSDFGFRDPCLARDDRERVHRMICQLTDQFVKCDHWDLAGELVLAQRCLGGDPVHAPSGAACIQQLRLIQLPNGAIPGPGAKGGTAEYATADEFFRRAYHTTLVMALAALVAAAERRA